MELWSEYGITGYNFSVMAQTFPLTYYCAEDAIKLQHPNLLVVDLFAATSYNNDFPNMLKTVDNLTFATRIQTISDYVPDERKTEYFSPMYLHHDHWDELEVKNFIPFSLRYAPKRNAEKGELL